jgi:altronate dehydratase
MKFLGYRRRNGKVGVRNIVAVIHYTACINVPFGEWEKIPRL